MDGWSQKNELSWYPLCVVCLPSAKRIRDASECDVLILSTLNIPFNSFCRNFINPFLNRFDFKLANLWMKYACVNSQTLSQLQWPKIRSASCFGFSSILFDGSYSVIWFSICAQSKVHLCISSILSCTFPFFISHRTVWSVPASFLSINSTKKRMGHQTWLAFGLYVSVKRKETPGARWVQSAIPKKVIE